MPEPLNLVHRLRRLLRLRYMVKPAPEPPVDLQVPRHLHLENLPRGVHRDAACATGGDDRGAEVDEWL